MRLHCILIAAYHLNHLLLLYFWYLYISIVPSFSHYYGGADNSVKMPQTPAQYNKIACTVDIEHLRGLCDGHMPLILAESHPIRRKALHLPSPTSGVLSRQSSLVLMYLIFSFQIRYYLKRDFCGGDGA
jgi:hypothetical protein